MTLGHASRPIRSSPRPTRLARSAHSAWRQSCSGRSDPTQPAAIHRPTGRAQRRADPHCAARPAPLRRCLAFRSDVRLVAEPIAGSASNRNPRPELVLARRRRAANGSRCCSLKNSSAKFGCQWPYAASDETRGGAPSPAGLSPGSTRMREPCSPRPRQSRDYDAFWAGDPGSFAGSQDGVSERIA